MATTAVFSPGKSHEQRSLVGYSPWGCKMSHTTWQLNHNNKKMISIENYLVYLMVIPLAHILYTHHMVFQLSHAYIQSFEFPALPSIPPNPMGTFVYIQVLACQLLPKSQQLFQPTLTYLPASSLFYHLHVFTKLIYFLLKFIFRAKPKRSENMEMRMSSFSRDLGSS